MSRTHLLATGRAFLFDMDGTILDSNAIVEKLWRVFAKRHNLDADDILSFSHGRPSITTIAHFLPDLSADEHQHLSDERTAEEIRITSGNPWCRGVLSTARPAGRAVRGGHQRHRRPRTNPHRGGGASHP